MTGYGRRLTMASEEVPRSSPGHPDWPRCPRRCSPCLDALVPEATWLACFASGRRASRGDLMLGGHMVHALGPQAVTHDGHHPGPGTEGWTDIRPVTRPHH